MASALAEPPQKDSAKAKTPFPKPRSPPQRIDQLIHFVDEVLHLRLVVAAIGPLAEVAHAVAVVARLLERIRDRVGEIGLGGSLLDVRIE